MAISISFTNMIVGDIKASGYNASFFELTCDMTIKQMAARIKLMMVEHSEMESDEEVRVDEGSEWANLVDWEYVAHKIAGPEFNF